MTAFILSDHAKEEAERRNIPIETLNHVMQYPQQVITAYGERQVYQSKIEIGGKLYLIRVIVEPTDPLMVITVYRTSQIEKYWKDEA
jgi:hypothetical protein